MKVVAPDPLLRDAAEVLAPVRDDVVIIGASAVTVALYGHPAAITPTRDVDAGTTAQAVNRVVAALEDGGLEPGGEPHERAFTWVRGTLKVQLIRPYHPFAKGAAAGLPVNNTLTELDRHRVAVAFTDAPDDRRLWCANAAALVALKGQAFGRTRPGGAPVERDYSDAVLLLEHGLDEIVQQTAGDVQMRNRVTVAASVLADDETAIAAAVRQLVASSAYGSPLVARQAVSRAATRALRALTG